MAEPPKVVTQLKLLSKTGNAVVGHAEFQDMECLLESLKDMQQRQVSGFVEEAGQRPLLISYSNDGTQCRSMAKMKTPLPDATAAGATKGRQTVEVLVQQVFMRYMDASGACKSRVLTREPLHLSKGKSGAAIFSCSKDFIPLLRSKGHTGICVNHYVFDGALHSYLCRRLQAYHDDSAIKRAPSAIEDGQDPEALFLKEWFVSTQCAAHMAHNALKWGSWAAYPGPDYLEDLWKVFAGIRNSVNLFSSHVGQWIAFHMEFRDPAFLPAPEESLPMWSVLGLKDETLRKVAQDWRLIFHDGSLLISAEQQHVPDICAQVTNLFLKQLSTHRYSKSRWLTVGKACRGLTIARMMGLDAVVKHIQTVKTGELYHLNGYNCLLEEDRAPFTVVVGLAGYVPDAVLKLMLHDSRGVGQVGLWREAAQAELSVLSRWSLDMWHHICARGIAGGLTARALHDKVMVASLEAMSFLDYEAFKQAEKLPWSLAQGDIQSNLRELQHGPDAAEETTCKVQALLRGGHCSIDEVAAGVELLLQVPWATTSVEQAHSSVTLIKRQHPLYEIDAVLIRAGLHTARRLLPGKSSQQKALEKVQQQIRIFRQSNHREVSGSNMYLQALCEAAKGKARRHATKVTVQQWDNIFKKHHRGWAQLAPHHKAEFEQEAKEYLMKKAISQSAQATALQDKLGALVAEVEEQERLARQPPLLFSTCQLTDQDLDLWQTLYDQYQHNPAMLKEARDMAKTVPDPIEEDSEDEVAEASNEVSKAQERAPAWVTAVANLRDQILPHGLRFTDADGTAMVAKIVYCKQSPPQVHGVLLEEVPEEERPPMPMYTSPEELWRSHFKHVFKMDDPPVLVTWETMPRVPIHQVEVLPHLVFRPGHLVCSDADYLTLEDVIEFRQIEAKTQKGTQPQTNRKKRKAHRQDDILAAYPGAAALLASSDAGGMPSSSTTSGGTGGQHDDAPEKDWTADDVIEEFFSDLEHKRGEAHGIVGTKLEWFRSELRGGDSEVAKGRPRFSGWQGQVKRNSPAHAWCQERGFQSTKLFKLSLGEAESHTLGEAWAYRMEYLFNCDQEGLFATPQLATDTMAQFQEGEDFQKLAAEGGPEVQTEIRFIRSLTLP